MTSSRQDPGEGSRKPAKTWARPGGTRQATTIRKISKVPPRQRKIMISPPVTPKRATAEMNSKRKSQ